MTDPENKPQAAEATAPIAAAPAADIPTKWPTVTVDLMFEIVGADGAPIKSMTFYEPDVEALERIEELDIKAGEKIRVRHLRGIAAALSRQPDEVIRRLNAKDFAQISEKIAPFLEYMIAKAGGE